MSEELILLGAGASVEADIPASFDLSKELLKRSRGRRFEALSFVIGGLLFNTGIRGQNPFDGVDVEELFSVIAQLANRNQFQISPFVGAWHKRIDELANSEHKINARKVAAAIRKEIGYLSGRSSRPPRLESELEDALIGRKWDDEDVFFQLQKEMIRELKGIMYLPEGAESRVQHLFPIIDQACQRGRINIATLNYDNTIEVSAALKGVACTTGIDKWCEDGTFPVADGVNLLKLHGSIDWKYSDRSKNRISRRVVEQYVPDQDWLSEPALIFGTRNKLTVQGPFLDLLMCFRERLASCSRLLVVGYSFRDMHVNEYIARWIDSGRAKQVTVIDPSPVHNIEYFESPLYQIKNHLRDRFIYLEDKAGAGLAKYFSSE